MRVDMTDGGGDGISVGSGTNIVEKLELRGDGSDRELGGSDAGITLIYELRFHADGAGRGGSTQQDGGCSESYGDGVAAILFVAQKLALALYGKENVLVIEAAHVVMSVNDGTDDGDEVAAVGTQGLPAVINRQLQACGTACRKALVRSHHLSVHKAFGQEIIVAAVVAGVVDVVDIAPCAGEGKYGAGHGQVFTVGTLGHHASVLADGQPYGVAVAIDGDIVWRERCQLVGDEHHGLFALLGSEHIVSIFFLSEGIEGSAVERVGVIATLVFEGMPQATAKVFARHLPQRLYGGVLIWRVAVV